MTDLPDPGTDPIPEGNTATYGFIARLIGLPVLEERLLAAISQMFDADAADTAALEAARDRLTAADTTIDEIEKGT